jgi:DNA repair protein RadC
MNTLKNQPISERPREKLIQSGIDHLTTQELLMILLGSGNKQTPVQTLAQKIEKLFEKQKQVSLHDLLEIKGIGFAKACQIVAAMEIVERVRPSVPDDVLDSVDKVLIHLYELKKAQQEHIVGLYLNARMRLVAKETLSIGAMNQALITPKEVFGMIKQQPIMYLILAHNHPSGDTKPSDDDLAFTKRMKEAGELLGVKLLDHIIIGRTEHYSFKNKGLLQ